MRPPPAPPSGRVMVIGSATRASSTSSACSSAVAAAAPQRWPRSWRSARPTRPAAGRAAAVETSGFMPRADAGTPAGARVLGAAWPAAAVPCGCAAGASVPERVRDLAAVGGQFAHHRAVQGDVLLGAAVGAGLDAQFGGQLLARGEAGIEVDQLQQVQDRTEPCAHASLPP